ncbi:MAG TPA: sulfatase/phosphatase domain-containing protein, partial [Sphingobacteriaceae bacterium]
LMKSKTPKNWRTSLYYHYYDFPAVHSVKKHEGVANKRYKLMHFYEINEWELYDLEKDPNEMQNQYNNQSYAAVVKEMKNELVKLKKQYKAE